MAFADFLQESKLLRNIARDKCINSAAQLKTENWQTAFLKNRHCSNLTFQLFPRFITWLRLTWNGSELKFADKKYSKLESRCAKISRDLCYRLLKMARELDI